YEGEFYDVPEKTVDEISHTLSVDSVKLEDCKLLNHNSVGGALFMDKSSHIRCGMENEHFVSWGMEDNERAHRWTKLGYRLLRTPGVLYHLEHPRSPDSSERNPGFQANEEECEKVKNMTPDQLVAYVDTWSWPKKNV
ncbi:MAG: galactosyltransferase-related protein, partial [Planctomycetota bacterium]|nr:galactosyltransferase-related protein [Planctomycetota bacterium]